MKQQKKKVNLCITVNLRDFPAIEDIVNELGYQIKEVNFVDIEEPAPIPRKRPDTYNKVTRKVALLVKNFKTANPDDPAHMIKRKLNLTHSISTINNIIAGKYDHLLKGDLK